MCLQPQTQKCVRMRSLEPCRARSLSRLKLPTVPATLVSTSMSGDRSRRGSALLNELNRAEAKLGSLEEFIRERERQLHVAVSRLHGGGNAGRRSSRSRYANRRRRAGITGDALLRMRNSISQESFEQLDDGKCGDTCLCIQLQRRHFHVPIIRGN